MYYPHSLSLRMGFTVYQVNIRNFKKNKYLLSADISQYNPDIILLNEVGKMDSLQLKLRGYKGSGINLEECDGVAIFTRYQLAVEHLFFVHNDIMAIKLTTNMGHIIIATSYSPPRRHAIPTVSLNRLFSFQCPVLFIGDLNAHHYHFHNSLGKSASDIKGKQTVNLINQFKLNFLGPDFPTYISSNRKGKPDIILANPQFSIFNHLISPGNNIGSDHIPIIMQFQIQPFMFIKQVTNNIRTLDSKKFQEELSNFPVPSLHDKPISEIATATDELYRAIKTATSNNCKKSKTKIIETYKPTRDIVGKLHDFQTLSTEHHFFGKHNKLMINEKLKILTDLIINQLNLEWNKLTKLVYDSQGDPSKFWREFNKLRGCKSPSSCPKFLKTSEENLDSDDDSNYGDIITDYYSEPADQANLMSRVWDEVFQNNDNLDPTNPNVMKVNSWYDSVCPFMQPKQVIDLNSLPEGHPLMRPISLVEINNSLKFSKNKAPGPSGIGFFQLKLLPINCRNTLVSIFNSILCTYYYPSILEKIKMIFIKKPNKAPSDPLNYRPICLLETILKLFERILAQRLSYFLEANNLLSEKQFGFRPHRNTQHPITLISEVIKSNQSNGKVTLIATRDVEKAFDRVWQRGLLFKLHKITNNCLEFTSLIKSFLDSREISPYFNGHTGTLIFPRAGVPQGSSLGPILFNIFVNDLPQPIHLDTIITQFADDIVHTVCSDGGSSGKNRVKQAKIKLEMELQATLEWELDWGIKSNLSKSNVKCIGTTIGKLKALGGITSNQTNIPLSQSVKVLGANLLSSSLAYNSIRETAAKANKNITKLMRFNNAPIKLKKTMFKSLIRPILEYPVVITRNLGVTAMRKLQAVQNRAIRFIKNIKKDNRLKMKELHEELNLPPLNCRFDQLANKAINRMKEYYNVPKNQERISNYKYSDYSITSPPLRTRRKSIIDRINKNIMKARKQNELFKTEPLIADWSPPQPIYVISDGR